MSFKLQQASSGGGKELARKQVIHHGRRQIKEVHVYYINSLLQVEGLLGGFSVKFLLDSGAAVSVVCYAVLSEEMQLDKGLNVPVLW